MAESFPWSEQSCFAYTLDNHNSIVGMREHALHSGAEALAVQLLPSAADGEDASARPEQSSSCMLYGSMIAVSILSVMQTGLCMVLSSCQPSVHAQDGCEDRAEAPSL